MKCINPTLVRYDIKGNRVFRSFDFCSKKLEVYYLFIKNPSLVLDCGRCIMCRKKKAFELASRCVLHASMYEENCFLTLTYDEKKEGYHNEFTYKDIQLFKNRLRSYCRYHFKKKIEVFNVHEYGRNGKKHWHLIVFNHEFGDKRLFTTSGSIPIYTSDTLSKLWTYGYHTIGDVTTASAMYQSQYMEKDFKNDNVTSKKKSHSKHSGIGRPYFLAHYKQLLALGYIPINNQKLPIPRYFEKIAHKHWSHFYERSNFFDVLGRKALYRPFKEGEENKEIADLYAFYKKRKQDVITELELDWKETVNTYLTTKKNPDFIKSGENYLYDLKNKQTIEKF